MIITLVYLVVGGNPSGHNIRTYIGNGEWDILIVPRTKVGQYLLGSPRKGAHA